MVDHFSDILMEPDWLDELSENLLKKTDNYNKAISQNAGALVLITPSNTEESEKDISNSDQDYEIPENKSEMPSKDSKVIFNIIEERNNWLKKI